MSFSLHNSNSIDCQNCVTRKLSVLNCLSEAEIEALSKSQSCISFKPGKVIFKEGGYSTGLYIIKSGKIKFTKTSLDGREFILRFGVEGDIVGYRSIVSETPYQCTAIAVNTCSVCFIPKEIIKQIIVSNHSLSTSLFGLLAFDLKDAETRNLRLAQKTVRERMAESIILLKEIYGFEKDSKTINVKLSRAEIAGIAGTVRESASRYLSEFHDSGLIQLIGKKIIVLDLTGLVLAANLVD